jgi:hypothetical protein
MWRRRAGLGGLSMTESWWTDEDAVAANVAGRVTPAQYAVVAGRRIPPPYRAYALFAVWLALVGLIGVAAIAAGDGPGGNPDGLAAAALIMAVFGGVTFPFSLASALPAGLSRWRARARRRRRIAALVACRVSSAVGEVVAGPGGEPEALVGASRLSVPEGAPALPPPGDYRLYWLESLKAGPGPLLLSAQPLDRQEAGAPADFVPVDAAGRATLLLDAMGLTQRDLAANRAGRLTARQRWPLIRRFCLHALCWGLGAILGLGIFLWPGVAIIVEMAGSGPTGPWFPYTIGLLLCLAFCACFAVPFAFILWSEVAESRLIVLWRVLRTSDPVRCAVDTVSVRGAGTWWQLSAGGTTFTVASTVAQTFLGPGRYVLYHLPGLRILLSAEPEAPK